VKQTRFRVVYRIIETRCTSLNLRIIENFAGWRLEILLVRAKNTLCHHCVLWTNLIFFKELKTVHKMVQSSKYLV